MNIAIHSASRGHVRGTESVGVMSNYNEPPLHLPDDVVMGIVGVSALFVVVALIGVVFALIDIKRKK